jgi:hypothetical protein
VSKSETLTVNVCHDMEQSLWFVLSSNIPGLHAEAETLDELLVVIADVTPDLITANSSTRFV